MILSQINLRVVVLITIILSLSRLAHGGNIKLFGPRCGDGFGDDENKKAKCGSTIKPTKSNKIEVGSLCEDNKPVMLRIVRDDADVDGKTNFVIKSHFSLNMS